MEYRFQNERELEEAQEWFDAHPQFRPSRVDLVRIELSEAQVRRRERLAEMFGDWADVSGEKYEVVKVRDDAREALIAKAGLTDDEKEVLKLMLDDASGAEIREYFGLESDQYKGFVRAIRKKLHYARN